MISGIIGMPPFSTFGGAFIGAILGLVFGAAGFVVGLLLVFASIPAGLIAGIVSLRRANRLPNEYGGRGFALAGIICSSIALLILPVIAAIAVPNLLASRRAANEGAAILTVRKLATAEQVFMKDLGSGHCGDLNIMVGVGLIDKTLEKCEKSGYRFQISNYPDRGCEIHAMPLSSSTGERSFLFSTKDGHMRAAARNGKPADKDDPALDPALHVDIDRQPTKVASGRNL
jgi:type II secretory pathway pseudopilin PulG